MGRSARKAETIDDDDDGGIINIEQRADAVTASLDGLERVLLDRLAGAHILFSVTVEMRIRS